MAIKNEKELIKTVENASKLLQDIQDYCGDRSANNDARVKFPRGFIRTASSQKLRINFIKNKKLRDNLSYTLMLSDTILWLINRTDIASIAKEMLIKLYIFIGGSLVESITKDYLSSSTLKKYSYKKRTQYLLNKKIINSQAKDDLDWMWDTRNKMHIFMLDSHEYINTYDYESHVRCTKTFRELIDSLNNHNGKKYI